MKSITLAILAFLAWAWQPPATGKPSVAAPVTASGGTSTACADAATGGTARYLLSTASGANNGTSWTDAWTSLATAETNATRGQTVCIGDGSYGGVTFNTATSGSTLITFKKATVADHGTSTGWSNGFGDGVATFSDGFQFASDYWVVDGAVGGGPGSWTSGYGFKIDQTGASDENGISISDGTDNITARHIEIAGHGDDAATYQQDLINSLTGTGPLTFSYLWLHDSGRTIIFNRSHNVTYEYLYTGPFESTAAQHAELASIWIDFSHTLVQNIVFRWSIFTDAGSPDSTGGIICECDNLQIYGNVFAPLAGGDFGSYGNGLVGIWSSDQQTNTKIYNNTFIQSARVFGLYNRSGSPFKSATATNNLFYAADVGNDSEGYTSNATFTHTYNYYISIGDGPVTEATQQTGASNPFVNWTAGDFRLTGNTTAGTSLSAPYNTDMCGHTRTTWTRGAIEYTGGAC